MPIKELPKVELQECLYGDSERLEVIEDDIVDNSRWSIVHDLVVKDHDDGKFYSTYYSEGATELQPESPFEYEPDMVACVEVVQKEVTVIQFVTKED